MAIWNSDLRERGLNDSTAGKVVKIRLLQKSTGSVNQAHGCVYSHSWNEYLSSWLHCHSLVNAPDFITSLIIYLTSYHLEPSDVKTSTCCCSFNNGNVNSGFYFPTEVWRCDLSVPWWLRQLKLKHSRSLTLKIPLYLNESVIFQVPDISEFWTLIITTEIATPRVTQLLAYCLLVNCCLFFHKLSLNVHVWACWVVHRSANPGAQLWHGEDTHVLVWSGAPGNGQEAFKTKGKAAV